ncbi:MAG: formyltransferase family protein [Gammaproteobacteria bacterium]
MGAVQARIEAANKMKNVRAVLLMPVDYCERTILAARSAGLDLKVSHATNLKSLNAAVKINQDLLLSFGSSTIVPSHILKIPGLIALNVHSASPDYPGRDPHHFAVYERENKYGATLHYMTPTVDAGPIVDVEIFDVDKNATPYELLSKANDAGWVLLERFFKSYSEHGVPDPNANLHWGERRTTRKMFEQMCCINVDMSREEIELRIRATEMPGYNNLYVLIHGYKFRIEQ